jgi:hypothetical protein
MFKYYLNRGLDAVDILASNFSDRIWFLPDLICPDLIDTIRKHVGKIEFYHIENDLSWAPKIIGNDPKIFFSIDFFGKETQIGRDAPPNTIVIRDSVWFPYPFSPVEYNQIWFNSLRKIFHADKMNKGSNIISPYRLSGVNEVPNLFYHPSLTWNEMCVRFENYYFCKEILSEFAIPNHDQQFPSVFPIVLNDRAKVLTGIELPLPRMWLNPYNLPNEMYNRLAFIPLDSRFLKQKLADLACTIRELA